MKIDVDGTRLWFDVDGPALAPDGDQLRRRPTVVLVHGGPGVYDHSYFKPDFGRLAEHAQVVYLDLPGHGRSDWGDPVTPVAASEEIIEALPKDSAQLKIVDGAGHFTWLDAPTSTGR